MSVAASDIRVHLAANHAEDDSTTQGGAVDASGRVLDDQFTAAAQPAFDSDNAGDTQNCTVVGRLASGIVVSETLALTGTTEKVFTNSFERILKVTLASPAAGTITLAQGSGGTVRHTFNPSDDIARSLFYGATADVAGGSTKTRYEKVFVVNGHATDSALNLTVELTTDPRADYDIARSDAVDDSETTANRTVAPTSVGAFGDGPLACANTDLDAGEGQGIWLKQVLAAGETPDVDEPVIEVAFATV